MSKYRDDADDEINRKRKIIDADEQEASKAYGPEDSDDSEWGPTGFHDGPDTTFVHCCDTLPHDFVHPCPVCREYNGFHNEALHGNVDPKYYKEKGWHRQ